MLMRMRRTDPWCSHALLAECKMVQLLWESIGHPHKAKHVLTIWPRNCTPGHFPGKWKLLFTQNTTETITVDLFVTAPNRDNQNVPHRGMAKNPRSIHSMDPPTRKRNKALVHVTTWGEQKGAGLSGRVTLKSLPTWHGKIMELESRLLVFLGRGWEKERR